MNYRFLLLSTFLLLPLCGLPAVGSEPTPVPILVNGRAPELAEAALLVDGHLLLSGTVLASEFGVTVESTTNGSWVARTYGHQLSLRPDNRRYWSDKLEKQTTVAPLYRADDLFIPLEMLQEPLQLSVTRGTTWELHTPAASVLAVRQGTHPDKVRFVVDLSGPVQFRWREEAGKVVVEFPALLEGDQPRRMLRLYTFDETLAPQVTEIVEEGLVRLVVSHTSTKPAEVFTLSGPPRLVLDLYRETVPGALTPPEPEPTPTPPVRPTAPCGPWQSQVFAGSKGPVRGYSLRVSLQSGVYTWKPGLAAETIMQRATTSRIARRNNAFAGINGGFFSVLGPPLGMLVIDGEWIKVPLYNRAVLGMTRDGSCSIRRCGYSGRVDFAGVGSLPLEGINQGHTDPDGVVAYTPRWGGVVDGAPGRTRLVVDASGKVVSVLANGEAAPLPPGGFVISGYGRRAASLAGICLGTTATLSLDTDPSWPGLWQAVGGGPLLVQDGHLNVTAKEERFRGDVAGGARPRSAVGLTGDGQLLLLAVQEPGLTLGELASVMLKLGARDAMNLDGGGSTALVVQGQLLNTPADGYERSVSNALLLFAGREGGVARLPEE